MSSLLLFLLLFLLLSLALAPRKRRLPPGPRLGWFVAERLPQSYQWLAYAKWRHTYGIGHLLSPHQR